MVSSPISIQSVTDTASTQLASLQTAADYQSSAIALPNSPLFGTDGIRGKVGDLLTASLALQVGFWAGVVLRQNSQNLGSVIVGQDSRNSSDMLAMAVASGLASSGLEVWHLGLCPTPCVAYLTSITDAVGGVMISASHNPPADNGIKFFGRDGAKLPQSWQTEIEAGVRSQTNLCIGQNAWGRSYLRSDLVQNYTESLKKPLLQNRDFAGMRIVLDLAWGAAVNLAPAVFQDLGAEVICLHDRADGDRINVECGSTCLTSLQAAVREHRATLGFAFDGDADRVLAVDDKGRPVDGDYILYLWGKALQTRQQLPENLIISTVMANLGFERAWEKIGGRMIRTPVGDQYVQAEMVRTGGMLGGEQSGHILCRHYSITGDGLLTALHIAALVQYAGVPLSEMVSQSFATYPQLLRNVRVEDRDRRMSWNQCTAIQQAIARAEAAMGNQGRILVRASGTEPVIRVMVEAASADLTQYWTENLVLAVQQYLNN
ncbi:phosphoglucosamine mutase [Gloeocapsopsis crepidinum LEGE 06123]|uniref:Phosphoglucosamine mutase n=1 Tax=Gloeocapsopsis crepidinum LEGE 06123 TaxID=588587 RepID=A0ABR9UPA7_9CHRO|nr:phosphoglucosamine mutase [Gloeocapsopsis crepidinum]MBE9190125.1 phosphoglucosamine mutase [Gloeocapsopsis crepidinum LEGE 06123]